MSDAISSSLLDETRRRFADAAERVDVVERWLQLGGRPVLVRAAGRELSDRLLPPLDHLATPPPGTPPALTVSCWDAVSTGTEPLGLPTAGHDRPRYVDLHTDRCLMAWPAERLLMAYQRSPTSAEAWWWVADTKVVPMFELAMPFRPILHWWSEAVGLLMVHAGAVGTPDGGAVLLGGVSGSGKSTTALWSLRSPHLRFLGDDYVLVAPSGSAEVFSIYTTAKVHEPDQHRVPHVRTEVVGQPEEDKLVAFLARQYPDRVIERLPLRAVLLPRVTSEGPSTVPIGASQALRRLGPSTVLQFPAPDPQRLLGGLARLVRSVPCFDFPLGPEPAATPEVIEGLLAELAGSEGSPDGG